MKINVNIDKLVFEGFSHRDISIISSALQSELTQLVSENGVGRIHTRSIDTVNAGTIVLSREGNPHSAGVQVARSLYRSLSNHERL